MMKLRLFCTTIAICGGAALAESDILPFLDRGDFSLFTRSLNEKPYGYTLIDDSTGKAPAKQVERFEVRSGDCYFIGAWNDCEYDRERSELSEQGERSPRGTTAWYGWSFYVPEDWPDIYPTKTVLGQFHQIESHPIWMFLNYNGGLVLDDQSGGRSKRFVPLVDEQNFAGRWHRVEVNAKWENDDSGFMKIWINGNLKFDYQGRTMTDETVYFKYGVYRSFVSRYKATSGQDTVPTQVAMFANVKKANTREGLK